ncbi:MAG: cobalt-precorrin-6A reductase [Clostridiaceae bacterium]|nr:cobalt-precorrin-6A reductase [Clostridiaceae bacterium]
MILALCGTSEGTEVITELLKKDLKVIATVTTAYGANLLKKNSNIQVLEEKLNRDRLHQLLEEEPIKKVIDITHPYAENISKLALEVCREKKVTYLRYERPQGNYENENNIVMAEDFYDAADKAKEVRGKIFLTVGSNQLPIFTEKIPVKQLVARVLPMSNIIKKCEDQGFTPDNLIAMKGPFSEEINYHMFKVYDASIIITKDSGTAGGTEEKIHAAQALNIPIILVKRPQINYGEVFWDLEELMKRL